MSFVLSHGLSECVAPSGLMGAHPITVTEPYMHVVFYDDRTGEDTNQYYSLPVEEEVMGVFPEICQPLGSALLEK